MLVLALLTDSHSDNIANSMIFSLYCKCGCMRYFGVFLVRDPAKDSRCVTTNLEKVNCLNPPTLLLQSFRNNKLLVSVRSVHDATVVLHKLLSKPRGTQ